MQRRDFIAALAGAAAMPFISPRGFAQELPLYVSELEAQQYAGVQEEPYEIPPVDLSVLPPAYRRQIVRYEGNEPPGTLIVDTENRFLYLVGGDGGALRYGVGIGRAGFAWSGRARIGMKREWPIWTPPAEMIARQPELEPYHHGMPPGLGNPLGARALYIFKDGQDTLYRLHGTADPRSIGNAVSSGCVRLVNQDIIDLFGRVPVGTQIVVQHAS